MRVSLAPAPESSALNAPSEETVSLFVRPDADVVLGWRSERLVEPIKPAADTMFGPRGACLHADGSLWVCDTGHHRLLGWRSAPTKDGQPADILIGQPDFGREGRNAQGTPDAATLNVPTGIGAWGEGLAVADAWNHRVLIWRRLPTSHNEPADIVLGQASMIENLANRGADHPSASTLHWPYGVAAIDGRLYVADAGNRRVLVWNDPQTGGQAADLVLGHNGFDTRDENDGADVAAHSMRWPHGAALWGEALAVCDAGNNRIMVWNRAPTNNGAPCDFVLGQSSFTACDHNRGRYFPNAAAVNMPYAVAGSPSSLIVADTANSRLLAYETGLLGAPATALAGQARFGAKGDNAWGVASRASLCWPYGLSRLADRLAVADSGNNRVSLFTLRSEFA